MKSLQDSSSIYVYKNEIGIQTIHLYEEHFTFKITSITDEYEVSVLPLLTNIFIKKRKRVKLIKFLFTSSFVS